MLTQNINALKICKTLLKLHEDDQLSPRMGMLDLAILLTINDSGDLSKGGIKDILRSETTSKSFLDRPIDRLLRYGLIDRVDNPSAKTKSGEARTYYCISKAGEKILKSAK